MGRPPAIPQETSQSAAAIEHDFEHKFKANVRERTTDSEWDIGVEGANPK